MNNPMMAMLNWHFRQMLRALGKPGLVAFVMLLLAVWVYFSMVASRQAELGLARQQYDAALKDTGTRSKASTQTDVADFYQSLPAVSQLSQQVRQLHQITEQHALAMGRVEYKLLKVNATSVLRYELRYSVVTTYPDLRHYIADLLSGMPNVALESLQLRRFDDKAEVPQADLVLALYFRGAS